MLAILSAVMKRGVMTSEFWLSVLALVLPFLSSLSDPAVQAWGDAHGWVGGLVVAVYVAARAYVKGQTVKVAAEPAGWEVQLGREPAHEASEDAARPLSGKAAAESFRGQTSE